MLIHNLPCSYIISVSVLAGLVSDSSTTHEKELSCGWRYLYCQSEPYVFRLLVPSRASCSWLERNATTFWMCLTWSSRLTGTSSSLACLSIFKQANQPNLEWISATWITNSNPWRDSGFLELDSRFHAQDSGFHKQKFPGFWISYLYSVFAIGLGPRAKHVFF